MRRIAEPHTLAFARHLIRAEQLRDAVLDQNFSPAEWRVLLELFVAMEEGRMTAITDMALIHGIARSTALDIVADMTRRELLVRKPDPADGRRSYLSLNETLHNRMNSFLLRLMRHLRDNGQAEPER